MEEVIYSGLPIEGTYFISKWSFKEVTEEVERIKVELRTLGEQIGEKFMLSERTLWSGTLLTWKPLPKEVFNERDRGARLQEAQVQAGGDS